MDERRSAEDGKGLLSPVLRPVRSGNGYEEALEQILRVIRLDLLSEGDRLPAERELALRLGVSRATLREVLRTLTEQGLVTSVRGRYGGTFVRRPATDPQLPQGPGVSAADLEDTLRFREVLEVGIAELAARGRPCPAARDRLAEALAATGDASPDTYRRYDTRFHLTLAELAGSPSLTAEYATVRARLNQLLDRIPLLVRNLEHAQRQHTELAEAVLAGDAESARSVMREHCAGTAALLRGFLP
ncbi:FCD domain-containing protein [Streptomyces sp. XM4193]|uniref:FadR/GntR family transcriptional regulator n=1 Tax=Streptomyces sp. XM4193 TaxID=2929782 RepID=UPI001FF87335|nr:FCD domain-containing protein [Streptomyces sp. XM4193]MCK1797919.1 FCD domain-containing protein [Streptomyces sp. XM4193]